MNSTTAAVAPVTFRARGCGETMTVSAPVDLHPRILAISSHCVYGEDYMRSVHDGLAEIGRKTDAGWPELAEEILSGIERRACDCRGDLVTGKVNTVFCRVLAHRSR